MKMCDCDNRHAAHCNLKTLHAVITDPFLLEKITYFIMFEPRKLRI